MPADDFDLLPLRARQLTRYHDFLSANVVRRVPMSGLIPVILLIGGFLLVAFVLRFAGRRP
ncbi:MAG: hypothetical protein WBA97_00560 [Actinophytocola sp.]|uniref:hypothetical protein n=1 Tax=Actinophytocola sp. TaxID=1872138 RepID=UPI003C786F05